MRERTSKPENKSHIIGHNTGMSGQAPASEILHAHKNRTLGRQPVQRESIEDEELLQGKFESAPQIEEETVQREEKPNHTGLPDDLKAGIENLSGYSMDDVKVHYNSDKPAQLNALAYAQGTDIHVASGQEKHLSHEAWHVVQQKQGKVQPTMQMHGVSVNDNVELEQEANVMGKNSLKCTSVISTGVKTAMSKNKICQLEPEPAVLNAIYENFVLEEDAKKIAEYTENKGCAISIRKTGKASLARLREGAGAKPHSILSKSLKKETVENINVELETGQDLTEIDKLKIVLEKKGLPPQMEGLVPHWINKNQDFDGFYITKELVLSDNLSNQYLSLEACRALIRNESLANWQRFFITGDYDVHDIVKFKKLGRQSKVSESEIFKVDVLTNEYFFPKIPRATDMKDQTRGGDTGILADINDKICCSDSQKRFQHGAQVRYPQYAESHNEIVPESLKKPSLPLALCDRGEWKIIESESSLEEWYNSVGVSYPWPK